MLHCSSTFTRPLKGTRRNTENQNPQAKLGVSDFLKLKFEFADLGICICARACTLTVFMYK